MSTTMKAKRSDKSLARGKGKRPIHGVQDHDLCLALAGESKQDKMPLNTPQVRVLRALEGTSKTEAVDMATIKDRVGIGRDRKYTQDWLNGVKALEAAGLIRIGQSPDGRMPEEGRRRFYYSITARGVKVLERLTKRLEERA